MSKRAVIFANTGTSVITQFQFSLTKGTAEHDHFQAQIKQIDDTDPRELLQSPTGKPWDEIFHLILDQARQKTHVEVSAETNSTLRIKELLDRSDTPLDQIHLLVTDTGRGVFAAQLIKALLEESYEGLIVELHRIPGLQVHSSFDFLRSGLPEYIGKIYELLQNAPTQNYRRIFNPTGGFKSLVPYLTIISMLENAEAHYIFERSDDLIALQPLPISIDEELKAAALPLLTRAFEEDHEFSTSELEEALQLDTPFYQSPHSALWTELKVDDASLWLPSGLGTIMYNNAERPLDLILISSEAQKDIKKLDQKKTRALNDHFQRLKDPDQRGHYLHEKYKPSETDCICFGFGRDQDGFRIFFKEVPQGRQKHLQIVRVFPMSEHDKGVDLLKREGIFSNPNSSYTPWT